MIHNFSINFLKETSHVSSSAWPLLSFVQESKPFCEEHAVTNSIQEHNIQKL